MKRNITILELRADSLLCHSLKSRKRISSHRNFSLNVQATLSKCCLDCWISSGNDPCTWPGDPWFLRHARGKYSETRPSRRNSSEWRCSPAAPLWLTPQRRLTSRMQDKICNHSGSFHPWKMIRFKTSSYLVFQADEASSRPPAQLGGSSHDIFPVSLDSSTLWWIDSSVWREKCYPTFQCHNSALVVGCSCFLRGKWSSHENINWRQWYYRV